MSRKPIIGITAGPQMEDNRLKYRVNSEYVDAVEAAGGMPIVLAPHDGDNATILDLVDGILFTGGADIDPAIYGDNEVHPRTYGVDDQRDRFELSLINDAIASDVPVFCICRGLQILNVAQGGTLIQDIPDTVSTEHLQSNLGLAIGEAAHPVTVEPGSLTASIFGEESIPVNSHHHQSVKDLAQSLQVEAIGQDGVIEAISKPGDNFVLGVQWHPELMFSSDDRQLKPFEAFVEAARARKLSPVS